MALPPNGSIAFPNSIMNLVGSKCSNTWAYRDISHPTHYSHCPTNGNMQWDVQMLSTAPGAHWAQPSPAFPLTHRHEGAISVISWLKLFSQNALWSSVASVMRSSIFPLPGSQGLCMWMHPVSFMLFLYLFITALSFTAHFTNWCRTMTVWCWDGAVRIIIFVSFLKARLEVSI